MNTIRQQLVPAFLLTVVLTVLLGIVYPLAVTGLARIFFPRQAAGSLIVRGGKVVGSRLLGQPFTSSRYFHSRPGAAGTAGAGYDATASGGTNLGPTNKKLIDRVSAAIAAEHADSPSAVPGDLVTSSASGLDPDITPGAAAFQVARVARERGLSMTELQRLVKAHTEGRQLGVLGEPRVNVLELNLALDALHHT
jgi:K+-transporting ATPase ATPase C chain